MLQQEIYCSNYVFKHFKPVILEEAIEKFTDVETFAEFFEKEEMNPEYNFVANSHFDKALPFMKVFWLLKKKPQTINLD